MANVSFGYTLSSEEHGPADLVDNAARAEEAGFEFLSISDHFHPWISAQGHSPFVWSVLGAIARATESIPVGVGVTCPIVRIHPAIIAQASATTSLLLPGRFFLGLGSGEALNEHIVGQHWPTPEVRQDMLAEAIEVIRGLWTGETYDHHGRFFTVENARLFDPPTEPPPIILSGFGASSAQLAGQLGDGYWGHSPEGELISTYRDAGGSGPKYAQLNVCWAEDEESAKKTVFQQWPNGGIPGQLSQDLPTWTHFEQAAQTVRMEDATKSVPCGPAVEPILDSVRQFTDAGYDHLYFHQVGPDQAGFIRFFTDELQPALKSMSM